MPFVPDPYARTLFYHTIVERPLLCKGSLLTALTIQLLTQRFSVIKEPDYILKLLRIFLAPTSALDERFGLWMIWSFKYARGSEQLLYCYLSSPNDTAVENRGFHAAKLSFGVFFEASIAGWIRILLARPELKACLQNDEIIARRCNDDHPFSLQARYFMRKYQGVKTFKVMSEELSKTLFRQCRPMLPGNEDQQTNDWDQGCRKFMLDLTNDTNHSAEWCLPYRFGTSEYKRLGLCVDPD